MAQVMDILIAALLVTGGIFALIGSAGLLKLRDGMQRLHAPTKGTTVGVGTALIASSLHQWQLGAGLSLQEILIVLFLFITAPLTALFLSKVYLHSIADRSTLPPTGRDVPWATFDTADEPDQPVLPRRQND
ncbi:MAG: Na+/H+ antiporter subunit G [Rhodobacteraceae bacterium]|jgi:multicomponent K+:H+ antiporter subunit G|nr:Na+/H+ antiporter subunit G [Paracoccaceae bacterium]